MSEHVRVWIAARRERCRYVHAWIVARNESCHRVHVWVVARNELPLRACWIARKECCCRVYPLPGSDAGRSRVVTGVLGVPLRSQGRKATSWVNRA